MFGNWWPAKQAPKATYEYATLPGTSWTRVVTLHPAQDGPPSVSIRPIDLADPDHPAYTAISYAWEGQTASKKIMCDERWLYITPTLFSCFLRLRDSDQSLVFWVDALSIDQRQTPDALEERAAQVRAMSEIFSRATKVTAWLGEITTWDEKVFQELQAFQRENVEDWQNRVYSRDQDPGASALQATFRRVQMSASQDAFLRRVHQLIDRPYFHRLWVRQEVALAKEIHFVIGRHKIQLSTFENEIPHVLQFAHYLKDIMVSPRNTKEQQYSESHGSFNGLSNNLARYDAGVNASFALDTSFRFVQQLLDSRSKYQLLTRSIDYADSLPTKFSDFILYPDLSLLATDTRDHVYALLSLCSDKHNPRLTVDYNCTQNQLATRIAIYLIEESHCARLLLERCLAATANAHGWRICWESGSTSTFWSRLKPVGFHCCPNTETAVQIKEVDQGPAQMIARGEIIGTLTSICNMPCPSPTPLEREFSMGGFFQQITEVFNNGRWFKQVINWIHEHRQSNDDPAEFERRCWTTIFADVIEDNNEVRRLSKIEGSTDQLALDKLIDVSQAIHADFKGGDLDSNSINSGRWRDSSPVIKGFCNSACRQAQGCKLALADSAHPRPCLVPGTAQVGDVVCIVYGVPLPMVLRHVDNHKGTFILVGPCYVDGVMDGELLKTREIDPDRNTAVVFDFALWPGDGPDDL